MTYHQALAKAQHRPGYRTAGRLVIDCCHALALAGVMTLPASFAAAWKDYQYAQEVHAKAAQKEAQR